MSRTRSELIDLILDAKKKYPEELSHIQGLPTMRKTDLQSVLKMVQSFQKHENREVEPRTEVEQEDVEDKPAPSSDMNGVVRELEFVDDTVEEEKVSGEEDDEVDPEAFIQSLEKTVKEGGCLQPKKAEKPKEEKVEFDDEEDEEEEEEKVSPEFRRKQREVEKEAKALLLEFKDKTSTLLKTPKNIVNKYGSLTEVEARDLTDEYNDLRESLEDELDLLFNTVEPSDTFYRYMNNLVKRQMNRIERVLN
jgi:hypothetical protein